MLHEQVGRGWRDRFSSALDRAESIYLRILRAVILVIATLMIGFALWLAVSSVYKMSRSPDSVQEEEASVAAEEITDAQMPAKKQAAAQAPYRQAEDKTLTRDEFDDNFIGSQARLQQVVKGDLDFESDLFA